MSIAVPPGEQPNINALWGALIAEELWRQGVTDIVIAPGSRSSPLVVGAARQSQLRCRVCVDERAAGFMALGMARASGRPAAVITTSGTAVANLGPAIVEASLDAVPLLLLTADRPPELIDCGANQSIRQRHLFDEHLAWRGDLPPPDDAIPATFVLTTVAHACAHARAGGPVQLNCALREPLAPTPGPWDRRCLRGIAPWWNRGEPYTAIVEGQRAPDPRTVAAAMTTLASAERGMVIAGAIGDPADAGAIDGFAAAIGWPIVADVRSGLRLGTGASTRCAHAARAWPAPDAIVQFGGQLTSRELQQQLDLTDLAIHVVIDPHLRRLDPGHGVHLRFVASPAAWCAAASGHAALLRRWDIERLQRTETAVDGALAAAIDDGGVLSEPFVARWLTRELPADCGLFLSSSMAIRYVQWFGVAAGPRLRVAANRGASGIDGVIASAAGFAAARDPATVLLIGDLAVLHDLGSMALLAGASRPLVVVILNNGGGAIFKTLPIAAHDDVFSPYFDTPHTRSFAGTAADFGLRYTAVDEPAAFAGAMTEALAHNGSSVIEIRSSIDDNQRHLERIRAAIASSLSER